MNDLFKINDKELSEKVAKILQWKHDCAFLLHKPYKKVYSYKAFGLMAENALARGWTLKIVIPYVSFYQPGLMGKKYREPEETRGFSFEAFGYTSATAQAFVEIPFAHDLVEL